MRCDALTADRIGAAWLRAALAPVSDFGRRAEDAARPFGPGDEAAARERCAQIVALAERLGSDGVSHVRDALRRAPDPADVISRATAGDDLSDVDFFETGRFVDALDATARAWDAAGGDPQGRPPVLPAIAALLAPGRSGGSFYVSDAFSPALGAARALYAAADAGVAREQRRLAAVLVPFVGERDDGEEFIVMRDALPDVPPGVRVIRETPAYRLLAMQLDPPALSAVERRDAAAAVVAREEEDVRRALAAALARAGPAVFDAARALGELDRTLARVAFTHHWGGCVPEFEAGDFAFEQASLVPLRAALADEGIAYTPISLRLRGTAVLTGPNMGGKSAALATCGFLAACVASGVPPPAQAVALPLLDTAAWIGGEAGADRARLLSAFGAEVVRTRDMLDRAGSPALVLVDEFARTTGPREGRALLMALVELLTRRGHFALVATHFEQVAGEANVPHFAIAGLGPRSLDAHAARDIHAALDAVAAAMDYRIVAVAGDTPSHSDALALARLLGLDAELVERAAALFAGMPAGPPAGVTE